MCPTRISTSLTTFNPPSPHFFFAAFPDPQVEPSTRTSPPQPLPNPPSNSRALPASSLSESSGATLNVGGLLRITPSPFDRPTTPNARPAPSAPAQPLIPPPAAAPRRSTRPRKVRVIKEVEPLTSRARIPAEDTPQGPDNEGTPSRDTALYDNAEDEAYRRLAIEEGAARQDTKEQRTEHPCPSCPAITFAAMQIASSIFAHVRRHRTLDTHGCVYGR